MVLSFLYVWKPSRAFTASGFAAGQSVGSEPTKTGVPLCALDGREVALSYADHTDWYSVCYKFESSPSLLVGSIDAFLVHEVLCVIITEAPFSERSALK